MKPIEKIAQWIEDKPYWWIHAARLAIQHGELNKAQLDDVYRIAEMQKCRNAT